MIVEGEVKKREEGGCSLVSIFEKRDEERRAPWRKRMEKKGEGVRGGAPLLFANPQVKGRG